MMNYYEWIIFMFAYGFFNFAQIYKYIHTYMIKCSWMYEFNKNVFIN